MEYRRDVLLSTALAVAFVTALSAQSPSGSQTKQPDASKITLTGCVERADQLNATGTAATTVDSLSFVLIHATKGTAADAPKGTTGAAGQSSAADQGRTYRLDAPMSKLNPHVGHKVEVTGAVDPSAADSAASGDPSSPSNAPKVTVESVKMLAETCAR